MTVAPLQMWEKKIVFESRVHPGLRVFLIINISSNPPFFWMYFDHNDANEFLNISVITVSIIIKDIFLINWVYNGIEVLINDSKFFWNFCEFKIIESFKRATNKAKFLFEKSSTQIRGILNKNWWIKFKNFFQFLKGWNIEQFLQTKWI